MTPPVTMRTPDDRFAGLPDYPFQPHYLEVDNGSHGKVRVHYLDEGPIDGDVFLLVHGEPSWSYLYRHWIPRLTAAGQRCVAPDHVGFGRSDKVVEESWYTIDRHVGVLQSVIDQLDLRRVHLFCQDWGGPIALRIACEHPHRFERLFIANTWLHHDGYPYSEGIRLWRTMALDPTRAGGDMPTGTVVARTLRREGHDLDAVRAAYDAPFTGIESKAGARRFPWCLPFAEPEAGGASWQASCFERLKHWEGPIHLVWGDADEIFPWEWAEQWARTLPGATLDRIAGAGHFLQEDAPGDCVEAILSHLG